MKKTTVEFRPCRKFPEYEVSASGIVRNRKYGNIVPHRVDPRDIERSRKVEIIRNQNLVSAFVAELVDDVWPELRAEAA